MNELTVIENDKNFIPVYLTDRKEKVVKGRELHNGLSVKQDYSNWIKKQLEVVDATEKDFYKLTFKDELSKTGQTKIEYILKLEIAKEICLVAGTSNRANNELKRKSKEYRRYLIAIEEKYNQLQNTNNSLTSVESKMDNVIEEINIMKTMVTIKKKDSNTFVKQIKRYLGINTISEDKYSYNTIKDMFLTELNVSKFEDIPVNKDNILVLDRICKSYKRKYEQLNMFDE